MAPTYALCMTCGNMKTSEDAACDYCSKAGAQAVSLDELKRGLKGASQPVADDVQESPQDVPSESTVSNAEDCCAHVPVQDAIEEKASAARADKQRIRPSTPKSPVQAVLDWLRGLLRI